MRNTFGEASRVYEHQRRSVSSDQVRYAIEQGVPAPRLAAAGFADNQPIDPGQGEEAYRRNRRIELKLTER